MHAMHACPPSVAAAHAGALVTSPLPIMLSTGALLDTLGLALPPALRVDAPLATGTLSIQSILSSAVSKEEPYALRCGYRDMGTLGSWGPGGEGGGGVACPGPGRVVGAWATASTTISLLDALVRLHSVQLFARAPTPVPWCSDTLPNTTFGLAPTRSTSHVSKLKIGKVPQVRCK